MVANLTIVRSGYLTGATVISVTTAAGTAIGIIMQLLISVLCIRYQELHVWLCI